MGIFQTPHLPGRTVKTSHGEEYLYFSGTDYLGMGHSTAFYNYLREGLDAYGLHYGSSRNNSLRLLIYEEAESTLAGFTGAPAALIVSSGMWAGQLTMKEIENIVIQSGDQAPISYHYAPSVHPAIWGNEVRIESGDWSDWAMKVTNEILENEDRSHIICTDAIGSPWVEDFDFSIFQPLSDKKNVWLIIDDSHGLGVRGVQGKGIFQELDTLSINNVIVVSSLNKAMGIPAGAILGNKNTIDHLRRSPWFAGASPPAPAYVYAFKELLKTGSFTTALEVLQRNLDHFSNTLKRPELFNRISGYPVFCSRDEGLFDHLLKNGIMASCFSYPSPSDAPVTRLAISALHQKEDLDRLAEVCNCYLKS